MTEIELINFIEKLINKARTKHDCLHIKMNASCTEEVIRGVLQWLGDENFAVRCSFWEETDRYFIHLNIFW